MKFEDTKFPFALNKHGYYIVGEKYFNSKYNALLEASNTKLPMYWVFNYFDFHKQCIKPRIDISLLTLYKERAIQLREKYDYLILAFSGGADSDNMLKAFIDNNIKIDEVWCDWPHHAIKKSGYVLNTSKSATNMPSEWFMVIEPALQQLAKSNPEIKIHLSDCTKSPTEEDAEDTSTIVSALSVYTSLKRYRYITEYVDKISVVRSVALVVGQDKVIPAISGESYGFTFPDQCVFLKSGMGNSGSHIIEYFYWTPDYPAIVVEQAHRVWDYLKMHQSFMRQQLSNVETGSTGWRDRDKSFDGIIKLICYPKWDFTKHQVAKSGHIINTQFSECIAPFKAERFYQSWATNMRNNIGALDPNICFETPGVITGELKPFNNFHKLGIIPKN